MSKGRWVDLKGEQETTVSKTFRKIALDVRQKILKYLRTAQKLEEKKSGILGERARLKQNIEERNL